MTDELGSRVCRPDVFSLVVDKREKRAVNSIGPNDELSHALCMPPRPGTESSGAITRLDAIQIGSGSVNLALL